MLLSVFVDGKMSGLFAIGGLNFLAHSAAPNVSPNTRYAIFFRLYHHDHGSFRAEAMTDIWLEYDGMREIVAAARS